MLSPETLEWLRQTARQGHSYSLAHLDHVERLDALCESLETALKRIAALESFFERAEAAVDPLLAGGPLPAGAAWTEREGVEAFTARPAPCSAAEAGEPAGDAPQTLHSVALQMVDTLARLGVLPEILDTLRRAIREPMEPAPAAAAAPVVEVEVCLVDQIRRHAPMEIGTTEAILCVVAAWLDRRGQHGCSLWLREQCAASQEERGNG